VFRPDCNLQPPGSTEDQTLTAHDMPTLDDLTREIADRLARVREGLSDEEFADLVRNVAETKLHFMTLERERALRLFPSRRPSLAQAIGAIPRLPRPPVSRPPRVGDHELRL
jgi:hypothetical protein